MWSWSGLLALSLLSGPCKHSQPPAAPSFQRHGPAACLAQTCPPLCRAQVLVAEAWVPVAAKARVQDALRVAAARASSTGEGWQGRQHTVRGVMGGGGVHRVCGLQRQQGQHATRPSWTASWRHDWQLLTQKHFLVMQWARRFSPCASHPICLPPLVANRMRFVVVPVLQWALCSSP